MACCLLLALYIQDEFQYDTHHEGLGNLYRVNTLLTRDNNTYEMPRTSPPIVWGVKDEIPEIETVTRIVSPPGVSVNLIKHETTQFYESGGLIPDSTFFDVFTFVFAEGNPRKALSEPNSVVVTQELARKLFGDESALNKIININQGGPAGDFKITGVLADNQPPSHIKANFFVSSACSSGWCEFLRSHTVGDEWAGQNFITSYVKLKSGHSLEEVKKKMNAAFQKHGAEDMKAAGMAKSLTLEPVQDIHLYSSAEQSPRISYLYIIASIGGFILLIACINFMNLSTAKATKRAAEVGLRKTLGANRSSLISQFLGEAMLIVLVAMVLSVIIIQLILPGFNQLTGKVIRLSLDNLYFIVPALAVITIATGLVAGSYPAFFLASFQPARILQGKSVLQSSNSLLRKSLVVFQFVIAISLVCGMVAVSKQLNYMQNKDLGFDTKHKVVLPLRTETAQNNYAAMRNELSKLSEIPGHLCYKLSSRKSGLYRFLPVCRRRKHGERRTHEKQLGRA